MFTVEVSIKGTTKNIRDAMGWLLAAWYKNGQLLGKSWPSARNAGSLRTFAMIPERDALATKHSNVYVRRELDEVRKLTGGLPKIRLIGIDPDGAGACACRRRRGVILRTNYVTLESPLRCATCFKPIPLYRVPPTRDEEHLDILQWASDYQACDSLQMNTAVGERFGEDQMRRHDSALSRLGIAICRRLDKVLGVPAFYDLYKYRGLSEAEELRRRCPGCRGAWKLDEPWHGFNFRCDRCRLVSNFAVSLSR